MGAGGIPQGIPQVGIPQGMSQVHQSTTSGGQLLFTQQQQQEMMQTLPLLQTSNMMTSQGESPPALGESPGSPLNLSTHAGSSVSGSPGSDHTGARSSTSSSAVINACSLCPAQFPTQDALALHMMYHANTAASNTAASTSPASSVSSSYPTSQQDAVFGGATPAGVRPNSAPLTVAGGHPAAGVVGVNMSKTAPAVATPSPWMCGKCLYSFDTCDTLAMHMMTRHANDHDAVSNLAVLQAAAAANQRGAVMASAAEIAQNVVQRMVQNMSAGNIIQQQQIQQQQQQLQQQQNFSEQQPVFPQPQQTILDSQQQQQHQGVRIPTSSSTLAGSIAGVKRSSAQSLPEEVVPHHEAKRRKNSQPMKKQWHCDTCGQTYPSRPEYEEHQGYCKAPPPSTTPGVGGEGEDAPSSCTLCDLTFPDLKSLGIHMRQPMHQHKLKQLGMQTGGGGGGTQGGPGGTRGYLGSAGEESVGYYSARSDSSSLSAYSDPQGRPLSVSPALSFSDAASSHHDAKMTPLNLMTDASATTGSSGDNNSAANRKERNKRAPSRSNNALSPESSVQQQNDHSNNNSSNSKTSSSSSASPPERTTPVQVPGHVSQSGLSPSAEEEEEESQDDEASEVMDFLTSRAKDLVMCKHCKIVYTDKTLYHLHMGLHNLNNQWQCNMCGKKCKNLHEFTSHVIHIKI